MSALADNHRVVSAQMASACNMFAVCLTAESRMAVRHFFSADAACACDELLGILDRRLPCRPRRGAYVAFTAADYWLGALISGQLLNTTVRFRPLTALPSILSSTNFEKKKRSFRADSDLDCERPDIQRTS